MRKGQTGWGLEWITLLIFLAIFAVWAFTYISNHTDGTEYFSRFHANDLATSAEVVNAGYGNVVLRDDNIKPDSQLTFSLANGMVAVGKTNKDGAAGKTGFGFYGKAKRYDGETTLVNPTFLLLRKQGDGFSISDANKVLKACRDVDQKKVPLEKAVVYLDAPEGIRSAFNDALKTTSISVGDQASASIRLTVTSTPGSKNAITFAATNPDGASLDCNFLQQLAAVNTLQFETNEPQQTGNDFVAGITITTKSDAQLLDSQVGQALAHALVVYYR